MDPRPCVDCGDLELNQLTVPGSCRILLQGCIQSICTCCLERLIKIKCSTLQTSTPIALSEASEVEVKTRFGAKSESESAEDSTKSTLEETECSDSDSTAEKEEEEDDTASEQQQNGNIEDVVIDDCRNDSEALRAQLDTTKTIDVDGNDIRPFIIVNVFSPDEIYAQPINLNTEWLKFSTRMNQEADFYPPPPLTNPEPGDLVLIKDQLAPWQRGQVVKVVDANTIEVDFFDIGGIQTLHSSSLFVMPPEFAKRNKFALRFKLASVQPKNGAWDEEINEALKKILQEHDMKAHMRLQGQDTNGLLLVDVYVERIYYPDPVERHVRELKNVAVVLREKGLLLMDRAVFLSEKQAMINTIAAQSMSRQDSTTDVQELHQLSWPKPTLPSFKADEFGDIRFQARIYYVDYDGNLYLQNEEQERTCAIIAKELGPFWNLRMTDEDLHWTEGEICIAMYPDLHIGWFRGLVVDASDKNKILVLFVDYGEEKYVEPSKGHIRKAIPKNVIDIPMQFMRCKLAGITPRNGSYDLSFLDDIHREIVEKKVQVNLRESQRAFPLQVSIQLEDGQTLEDLFVARRAAIKSCLNLTEPSLGYNTHAAHIQLEYS